MNQSQYRAFCQVTPDLPIFLHDWWLDATCGESCWGASLVTSGDKIVAVLPYSLRNWYGLRVIGQPSLTQYLGPWTSPGIGKVSTQLSREMALYEQLIQQLPPHHVYWQNWHFSQTNWLPFYWRGFSQTTRYTYRLSLVTDAATLWASLCDSTRREIRKAQNRFELRVKTTTDINTFIDLNYSVFTRQGLKTPYSKNLVRELDKACSTRSRRKIFIAEDPQGRIHAAIYVVWDARSAYYLMGGNDPAIRNSGAMSLCLWEAITACIGLTEFFDFEGSMIQSIEKFFRCFGASQIPYMHVWKGNGRLLSLVAALRRSK